MAKSITVGKRENEKKRLAKREEKQKKKDSKKLSSKSSFDDMIAYVDENGMITSTPPAENIKKEEINLDNHCNSEERRRGTRYIERES